MGATAKQPELVESDQPKALTTRPATDPMVAMFERLATNKDVDVEKLGRLIAMQERILARNAEAEFNAAFAEMQAALPTIVERAHTDKTTYAPLEDIVEMVRPVLKDYGFAISHRTEWPDKVTVKVVGILTHRQGHSRSSEFLSQSDQTGSKNAIQALGSAVQYGRRYTTKDLLCIVTRGEDDDGGRSVLTRKNAPTMPDGYDDWLTDLSAAADEGWPKLSKAFGESKPEFRKFLLGPDKAKWADLRKKAEAK